ncbi:hypothetical protein Tco_0599690 [Tanacetum coccineum]
MASIKYCDKHNQVGFLKKPEESTGFAEIVDFLKGSTIRYALTHNPTIHDSLVKQFWQTATAITLADGTLELRATIDTLEYIITEASIRSKLQLADALGISMLPNNEIFEGMGNMGYPTDVVAVDQGAGQADQAVTQPSPSEPLPSSSPPPVISATTESEPTPVDSLEKELKQTKLTMGKAIVKLVKKVKKMEVVLKRRHVVLTDSEDEDVENSSKQGRKLQEEGLDKMVRSIVKDKSKDFETPTQGKTLWEADISPEGLEAVETLAKVLTQRNKTYTRKVKTRLRRKLDADEVNTGEGINIGFTDVNIAFEEINFGNESIIPSPKKGQREGKAVLKEKSQSKKTKKQIREEQASLAEIVRLQAQEEAENARKAELERQDALIAKRVQDELELSETQKNRMAQVQEAAKYYTEEDCDSVRAKLEANRDMSSKVLLVDFSSDDFAKKMVELTNEKKRLYKEHRER